MKTISFINSKGGTGKTTLCANVNAAIQKWFSATAILIDADPQGSLRDWHNINQTNNCQLVCADTRQSLHSATRLALSSNYDYMLIDTPGHLAQITGAAISMSDLIIIPIQPSPLDVWSTIDTIDIVKSAMQSNPSLQSLFVVNRATPNCRLTTDLLAAIIEADPEQQIPVFGKIIHNRIAFARAASNGQTIFDLKDELAKTEIELLTIEIIQRLTDENTKQETK